MRKPSKLPLKKPQPEQAQPARFQYDLEDCGLKRALDLLGEKWTLLVLREAVYGVHRFDDFSRALRCGRGVLSARLKSLTRAGILESRNYLQPGQRPRAEYHLTEKGRDLYTAMLALSQWSDRWNPPPAGPAVRVLDRSAGDPVRALMTSRADVAAMSLSDVRIELGTGIRRRLPR
jgi:DNA-binding HxlR family transcriptional regulator